MNDPREFQDVESACSGRLSHFPTQPAVVPSPPGMPSRDQSLRPDTWNLLGTLGNVFDSPVAPIDSSSTPFRGMLHSWNPNATFDDSVRLSTARLVARSEERNRDTIPTPRFARKPSTMNSFFPTEGACPQNYMADQQNFRSRSRFLMFTMKPFCPKMPTVFCLCTVTELIVGCCVVNGRSLWE